MAVLTAPWWAVKKAYSKVDWKVETLDAMLVEHLADLKVCRLAGSKVSETVVWKAEMKDEKLVDERVEQ